MRIQQSKWGFFSRIKQNHDARRKSVDLSRYAGVLIVLCLVGVYGALRVISPHKESAQVRFVESQGGEPKQNDSSRPESRLKNPFYGSEYDTAQRLRETSALGMAISLSVFAENSPTGRLPENITGIFRVLNAAISTAARDQIQQWRPLVRPRAFSVSLIGVNLFLLRFWRPPGRLRERNYFFGFRLPKANRIPFYILKLDAINRRPWLF